MILEDARDSITSLVIRGATVIAGSVDGHIRTYDLRQGQLRTDFLDREPFPYLCFAWTGLAAPPTGREQAVPQMLRSARRPLSGMAWSVTSLASPRPR